MGNVGMLVVVIVSSVVIVVVSGMNVDTGTIIGGDRISIREH